jgi:uncharacterized membrane protein YfcA
MTPEQLVLAAVILLVASIIQSAIGFAFSLFAVPMLLFTGLGLPETVGLIIVASLIQRTSCVWRLRGEVDWRELRPLIVLGVLGLPFGLWILSRLTQAGQAAGKQAVGACILAALAARHGFGGRGSGRVAPAWGYAAGFTGGILSGFAAIGGPPLVLWMLAHRWNSAKMRVVILAYSLPLTPFHVVLLFYRFGDPVMDAMLRGMVFCPVAIIGSLIGMRLGDRIDHGPLRVAVQIVLALIGLSALLGPLVGL